MASSSSSHASSISRAAGLASGPIMRDTSVARAADALASSEGPVAQNYFKAHATTQQENDVLKEANSDLSRQLTDLKLHVKYTKRSTPESGTPSASHSTATYAQLFYSPTFPLEAFKHAKPTFAHDSVLRYANSDELVSKPTLGFTADIYHVFEDKYHSYI
ncbi:hypothetical protein HYPSUDRAFT_207814, partial [Hypholoma sublateritium FD-334 SS-4]